MLRSVVFASATKEAEHRAVVTRVGEVVYAAKRELRADKLLALADQG